MFPSARHLIISDDRLRSGLLKCQTKNCAGDGSGPRLGWDRFRMEFDDQIQVKIVRAVVVVNGEVSMATARRNGDEVGMSHQIGPAINEVHSKWSERRGVHCAPDLFDRCHGQSLFRSSALAAARQISI